VLASLVLLFCLSPGVEAASSASENWLLLERGNAAKGQGEFGVALSLYKQAIEVAGIFPEAEAAVGDIYAEEGEPDLAIMQYEKAYSQRKSFIVPDMQYDVLEKLASLYESLEKYKPMEDELTLIIQDDARFAETPTYQLRSQVAKNFADKGIDRVLVLYTFDSSFAAPAHAKLGWFYYRTGRYEQAVSHLLYAVIYRAGQVVRYLRDRDIEYAYSTLGALLASIAGSRDLAGYATETDFYRTLYYLAASAYATGAIQSAQTVWQALAAAPAAGQWQALAQKQLKKPFLEPLLQLSTTGTTGTTR
jgi:tetratricopeptide (TPR) repeat protein